jgi:hypothetical protein
MNNFEDDLDRIRIQLYEETKNLDKALLVKTVNANAKKIADELGIKIIKAEPVSKREQVLKLP